MAKTPELLIVGGGLTGPMLALALRAGGLPVRLLDQAKAEVQADPDFDGRAYALSTTSQRLLQALGLWPDLAPHAEPIREMEVWEGPGRPASPLFLHVTAAELETGPVGYFLEDRYLRAALAQALGPAGVAVEPETTVTTQTPVPGAITLTLADGTHRTGALAVGCDGLRSPTAAAAGIRRTGWPYRQRALVTALDHTTPHHGIARQIFVEQGPIALLPLPGNRTSLVWTEAEDRADLIADLSDDAYLALLKPRIGDVLGEVRMTGVRYSYPISLSLADSLVADRVALAGDAAHGIHPLAGQGLNLGIRDVAALAEVLVDAARRGEDPGAPDVLARYAAWRGFDIAGMAAATDTLNRVFSTTNPVLGTLRGLALGAVRVSPILRRTVMREAAGLTGALPRLLAGRPI